MIAGMPLIAVRDSACMQRPHALLDVLTGWRSFCSTLTARRAHWLALILQHSGCACKLQTHAYCAVCARARALYQLTVARKRFTPLTTHSPCSHAHDRGSSRHTRPVHMHTAEVPHDTLALFTCTRQRFLTTHSPCSHAHNRGSSQHTRPVHMHTIEVPHDTPALFTCTRQRLLRTHSPCSHAHGRGSSRHTCPVYMHTTEAAGLVDASVRCPNDPQQSRSDVTVR
jgi:hypothetical protein